MQQWKGLSQLDNNISHYNIMWYIIILLQAWASTVLKNCIVLVFWLHCGFTCISILFFFQNMEQQQIETSGKRKRKNPAPNRFSPADENTEITEKLLKAGDVIDENDNEAMGENDDQEMFVDDQEVEDDDNDSGMVSTNLLSGVATGKCCVWMPFL